MPFSNAMNPQAKISLLISGETPEAIKEACLRIAAKVDLANLETEELIAELRDRMARVNKVVRVEDFSEETAGAEMKVVAAATAAVLEDKSAAQTVEQPATKVKRTRKAAAPVEQAAPPADEVSQEVEEADTPEADDAPQTEFTSEDVKHALNEYAALHGQARARQLMQDVGGALRLIDVPAAKYGELVTGLRRGMQ